LKAFFRILFALLAIRLVLMAIVPVFEPSEARYAAIAANMARTGDFVVPRFTYKCEYQSFDGKPPLVFQAGGVCCRLLGTGNRHSLQLAVRIFPLLSAMLLLAILFHAVRITADVRRAWLAVAICATCTAFYAAAGMALTDMSLTCCTAGALLLYECCLEARRHLAWYLRGVPYAAPYKAEAVRVETLEDVRRVAKGICRDLRDEVRDE